jgi:hypothetical protein
VSSPESSVQVQGCVDSDCTPIIEAKLNTSTLSDPNAFYVSVSVLSQSQSHLNSDVSYHDSMFNANSLVDSGSDHCFIDTSFTNKHDLTPYSVGPYRLSYLDGSSSTITQGIQLHIRFPTYHLSKSL